MPTERENIFEKNREVIKSIKKRLSIKDSWFQVYPSIDGISTNQDPLPVIEGPSFVIDLQNIELPNTQPLSCALLGYCYHLEMEIPSDKLLKHVVFTPAATLAAGVHTPNDIKLAEPTYAEIVPAHKNTGTSSQYLFVLHWVPGNPLVDPRTDHIEVAPNHHMTCVGRTNGDARTLRPTETCSVSKVEATKPVVYQVVDNSRFIVVELEYELILPPPSITSINNSQVIPTSTIGNSHVGFVIKSIRPTVIVNGEKTNDNTVTCEQAKGSKRRLLAVRMLCCHSSIINTQFREHINYDEIINIMGQTVDLVSNYYKRYQVDIPTQVNWWLNSFNVNTCSRILEYSILKHAGIDLDPTNFIFQADLKDTNRGILKSQYLGKIYPGLPK